MLRFGGGAEVNLLLVRRLREGVSILWRVPGAPGGCLSTRLVNYRRILLRVPFRVGYLVALELILVKAQSFCHHLKKRQP